MINEQQSAKLALRLLIAEYWDIAYREGQTGENLADAANEVLFKIEALVDQQLPKRVNIVIGDPS